MDKRRKREGGKKKQEKTSGQNDRKTAVYVKTHYLQIPKMATLGRKGIITNKQAEEREEALSYIVSATEISTGLRQTQTRGVFSINQRGKIDGLRK